MFQQDYPGVGVNHAFSRNSNPNQVTPSFNSEYRYIDYYSARDGQNLQQYLTRMGYKFRAITDEPVSIQNLQPFHSEITTKHSNSSWKQAGASFGQRFVFRPLEKETWTKRERFPEEANPRMRAVSPPNQSFGYVADLPSYTSVDPVFRPIP